MRVSNKCCLFISFISKRFFGMCDLHLFAIFTHEQFAPFRDFLNVKCKVASDLGITLPEVLF